MAGSPSSVVKITPIAQNYAWGKIGHSSAVAQLLVAGGAAIDPSKPYAELWMGTHPSAPARLARHENVTLAQHLQSQNYHLGNSKWNTLPFLLKVLSIEKALSIQAHPDLERAKRLHAASPSLYPDANHKPELAAAVSPFEALCNFRPLEEICAFLDSVPELRSAIGEEESQKFQNAIRRKVSNGSESLRSLYSALMHRDNATLSAKVNELTARLRASASSSTPLEKLVLRINDQFPGDVGVFHIYLLNYVRLSVGEALFLAANEPHAYLSGDCVEVMASSDNVVRAGLTPKPKDVNTLVEMLTYKTGFPEILHLLKKDDVRSFYECPVEEFQLEMLSLSEGSTYDLTSSSPSIFFVYHGSGVLEFREGDAQHKEELSRGNVYFTSAKSFAQFKANTALQIYRAVHK